MCSTAVVLGLRGFCFPQCHPLCHRNATPRGRPIHPPDAFSRRVLFFFKGHLVAALSYALNHFGHLAIRATGCLRACATARSDYRRLSPLRPLVQEKQQIAGTPPIKSLEDTAIPLYSPARERVLRSWGVVAPQRPVGIYCDDAAFRALWPEGGQWCTFRVHWMSKPCGQRLPRRVFGSTNLRPPRVAVCLTDALTAYDKAHSFSIQPHRGCPTSQKGSLYGRLDSVAGAGCNDYRRDLHQRCILEKANRPSARPLIRFMPSILENGHPNVLTIGAKLDETRGIGEGFDFLRVALAMLVVLKPLVPHCRGQLRYRC